MSWEDDLRRLGDDPDSLPACEMVLRHWRRGQLDRSLIDMLQGDLSRTENLVALYPRDAPPGSKPAVVFNADVGLDLDHLPQEIVVRVIGWPEHGRGVLVRYSHGGIIARSPCRPAGIGSPRLERRDG